REPVPDFFNPRLGQLNWALRGIMYSNAIVVVSPTYAKEILTPEYGEGLDKMLSEKRHKITGILNGISYKKYNPKICEQLSLNYSIRTTHRRKKNKVKLQDRFGLPKNQDIFLAGIVSRFSPQKGFDLIEDIMDPLFKNVPMQLVVIGDGEARYKEMLQETQKKFPKKVSAIFGFDVELPHLIFGGADAVLVPSKFEPCGVVQMQAMRFGCIPIARRTGGLADTIKDFDPSESKGTGFLFQEYDPWSLLTKIVKAHTCFGFKSEWKDLVIRAMREDFSWEKSARKYLKVFKKVLKEK
ncbi:MAG: glycosyltransferase, partial [Candidatus Nealsonbacteria bacterium]|nr:glycosyltransferase [Candidatus Nealsonbacteria bacterium]